MKRNGKEVEMEKRRASKGRGLMYAVTHAISRLLMLSVTAT
jgi:hypothetical protein